MRRALLIGASGFLGGRLAARLGGKGIGTWRTRPTPNAVRFDAASQRLRDIAGELPSDLTHVIVPFGAIDMEGCARDPAGTSAINIVAVTAVLKDAMDQGLHPVFVSTDYVFGGERDHWTETDRAEPRMAYGAQKLAVEGWLGTIKDHPWTVVRLSKVVGTDTTTHSMLGQWITDLKAGKAQRCADDQYFSPAFVDDLADAIVQLAELGATGLYHAAGPERFSRIGLLTLLMEACASRDSTARVAVTPCSLHDLPFLEKRPFDTSLNVDKLRSTIRYDFKSMAELCAQGAAEHF